MYVEMCVCMCVNVSDCVCVCVCINVSLYLCVWWLHLATSFPLVGGADLDRPTWDQQIFFGATMR